MIFEQNREPEENEETCWTVATGNLPKPWDSRKTKREAKKALDYIESLEGFAGFHPMPPKGTLCIFRTLNNAKAAKNLMEAKGIQTGDHICSVFVDKKYLEGAETWNK